MRKGSPYPKSSVAPNRYELPLQSPCLLNPRQLARLPLLARIHDNLAPPMRWTFKGRAGPLASIPHIP